jgi:hypothetical protein
MANAANNANLFYSIIPFSANLTQSDFFANTGVVTIINNQAVFTVRANVDAGYSDETGETFRLQLRQGSPTGNIFFTTTANVAIVDTYKLVNYISLIESASTVVESDTVTFTFIAHNVIPGTVFYYDTVGNVTSNIFSTGNTGSFVMNSSSNVITLAGATLVPANETRYYQLNIRTGNPNGAVVMTSNVVTLVDSSIAYITATGGTMTEAAGYRIHRFNTSNVLNITSLGALGSMDILSIAGGGGGGGQPGQGGSGGGAGGYVYMPSASAILGNLTVTIGAGGSTPGSGGAPSAANGGNTSVTGANFANILSVGGGKGGLGANPGDNMAGGNGGSGGGSGYYTANAGTGYGFPGPAQQGFPGGSSVITTSPFTWTTTTGGGGAGAAGSSGTYSAGGNSGNGGIGKQTNISGSNVFYAGGGGGGIDQAGHEPRRGLGGNGGGGRGGLAGNVNSGGGGGGGEYTAGNTGGSGIVIIRYPYVPPPTVTNVITTASAFVVGSNITFTINTLNANTVTLYYNTQGNVDASYFIGGNTGSFVANASGAVFTLIGNTNAIVPVGQTRNFGIQIRQDSTTGYISGSSSNVALYNYSDYYVQATGGQATIDSGGYRLHVFTSSANLTVTSAGVSGIEYLAVAGGGGGGTGSFGFYGGGGGGGAGGLINTSVALPTTGNIVVTVGGGGVGNATGSNTTLSGIVSANAFGGGGGVSASNNGRPGGSGGGGATSVGGSSYGLGTTGQGFRGGLSSPITLSTGGANNDMGGGGGGAGEIGHWTSGDPTSGPTSTVAGGGGLGFAWIPASYGTTGSTPGRWFAGGGGGGDSPNGYAARQHGGAGGGGYGGSYYGSNGAQSVGLARGGQDGGGSANINTGGGGGGVGAGGAASGTGLPGLGGSGIVIIRYPYV